MNAAHAYRKSLFVDHPLPRFITQQDDAVLLYRIWPLRPVRESDVSFSWTLCLSVAYCWYSERQHQCIFAFGLWYCGYVLFLACLYFLCVSCGCTR